MGKEMSKMKKKLKKKKESNVCLVRSTSTGKELNLLSMPKEVVHHLAGFLTCRDLFALSNTCHSLRDSVRDDFIWRKHTREDSLHLIDLASIVPPPWTEPDEHSTSIECFSEHKLNVLRQTRLTHNIRKGLFVEHNVKLNDLISLRPFRKDVPERRNFYVHNWPINFRQTIYKGKFLFALNHNQTVESFMINDTIEPISKFQLSQQTPAVGIVNCNNWYLAIRVVGDLLIARSLTLFDVYKIDLPQCSFTFLHTITCPIEYGGPRHGYSFYVMRKISSTPLEGRHGTRGDMVPTNSLLVVSRYIFRIPIARSLVRIWDLQRGEELESIEPKVDGANFHILRFSVNEKYILLSVGLNSGSENNPHLFVFDIESLKYTEFCADLERHLSETVCLGLIDDNYVVLISIPRQQRARCSNDSADVYVFDILTSDLLVHESGIEYYRGYSLHLVNGLLVVPSLHMVNVMSLQNLQTVWKTQIKQVKSVEFIISPTSFFHFMVMAKSDQHVEFWDFEKRKKCFVLPSADSFAMDDTFCKLIVEKYNDTGSERNIKVLNFW